MPSIDGQRVLTDLNRLAEFGRYKGGALQQLGIEPISLCSRDTATLVGWITWASSDDDALSSPLAP